MVEELLGQRGGGGREEGDGGLVLEGFGIWGEIALSTIEYDGANWYP